MTNAALYTQAMRSSFGANVPDFEAVAEIPYPGLAQPHSQLAVPIHNGGRMLGVCSWRAQELQFSYEDEDALVAIAGHLGAAIELMQARPSQRIRCRRGADSASATPAAMAPLVVKHFAANDSIFLGDSYLIKGVAGAILWKAARPVSSAAPSSATTNCGWTRR